MAVGDIVEPVEEWRKFKHEKTGREWDYAFRRLFYVYNPDIAHRQFLNPVEIDSVDTTAGHISNYDIWIDREGSAHLLYAKTTVQSVEMRDRFFPGTPIVTSLEHCIVTKNKVARRESLITGGEGAGSEVPGVARFHSTPDGRLFVVYFCTDRDKEGRGVSENRIVEILPGGGHAKAMSLGLKTPLGNFMTATERGGSPPSDFLDILGDTGGEIRYARIRLAK